MSSASAPGKIILFGEHAVVYGRPALAVPVTQVHADVEVLDTPERGVWIESPGIDLHAELNSLPSDHPLAAVIQKFLPALKPAQQNKGIKIRISSSIPVASGLGSGAAVSVALIRALSSFVSHPVSDEQINEMAYEIEKIHHGTPSGIDNTVITYAKPVFFIKGQPMETFKVGKPFTIVIGDTGIAAPTKEAVSDVHKLWEADNERWEKVFDQIGEIVQKARRRIENGEWEALGELMNRNHEYLQELSVSSPELDRMVDAARKAGALGAKLSGGGRGGNIIALVKPERAELVAKSLCDLTSGFLAGKMPADGSATRPIANREGGNTIITTINA
jgi:mevalonate kinase